MTFKDQIAKDNVVVFMNEMEFAEKHLVNGKMMSCIIDTNELIDRQKRYQYNHDLYADGVYRKEILIYVKAYEFGSLPAIGRHLMLDNKSYTVFDAIDENGIYSISLEANKT